MANKTDLCSSTPPQLPEISFGQAVPSASPSDHSPSSPDSADVISPGPESAKTTSPPPAESTKPALPPPNSPEPGLKSRAITSLEGALFAKQHNLLYVETSAKEGWGIVEAFEWTAREVLGRFSRQELERRKVIFTLYCSNMY